MLCASEGDITLGGRRSIGSPETSWEAMLQRILGLNHRNLMVFSSTGSSYVSIDICTK